MRLALAAGLLLALCMATLPVANAGLGIVAGDTDKDGFPDEYVEGSLENLCCKCTPHIHSSLGRAASLALPRAGLTPAPLSPTRTRGGGCATPASPATDATPPAPRGAPSPTQGRRAPPRGPTARRTGARGARPTITPRGAQRVPPTSWVCCTCASRGRCSAVSPHTPPPPPSPTRLRLPTQLEPASRTHTHESCCTL